MEDIYPAVEQRSKMAIKVLRIFIGLLFLSLVSARNLTCSDDVQKPCSSSKDTCMRIYFTPHGGGDKQSRSLCGVKAKCEQEPDACNLLPWDTPGSNCRADCNSSIKLSQNSRILLFTIGTTVYLLCQYFA